MTLSDLFYGLSVTISAWSGVAVFLLAAFVVLLILFVWDMYHQ